MAVLSDSDRQKVWRAFMRWWMSQHGISIPNNVKGDIYTAISNTDAWIDGNQSSYNNALNNVFKNNASQDDKTILFCLVALMRSPSGEELLRGIAGEVS